MLCLEMTPSFQLTNFGYVLIWDILKRVKEARASESRANDDNGSSSDDEDDAISDVQAENIVVDGDGNVTAMTQYHQYLYRGNHLNNLPL